MSRRKKKHPSGKSHKIKSRRRSQGPTPNALPIADLESLLQSGTPPELAKMLVDAEKAAMRGDLEPLRRLKKRMDSLAELQPARLTRYSLSTPAAAKILDGVTSFDDPDRSFADASRKAIAVDPNSVEALLILGDLSETIPERVKWYRRASEAAASKPKSIVREKMPEHRLHMGRQLTDVAKLVDAAEILSPALDEDPGDELGIRFDLISLYLRLRWYDEANDLLDRFSDDEFGILHFAKAIFEFQAKGPSEKADQLLKMAHKRNPFAAAFLSGDVQTPTTGPNPNLQIGSRDEAIFISLYLLPAVHTIEGTTRWIRDTLDVKMSATQSSRKLDRVRDGESPRSPHQRGDLHDALNLRDGKTIWQYYLHLLDDGEYIGLVLEDLSPIGASFFPTRPNTSKLRSFIKDVVCDPLIGKPRKPRLLRVPTKADLKALAKPVGTYGVACEQHVIDENEKQALIELLPTLIKHLNRAMSEDSDASVPADETDLVDISDLPQTEEQWLTGVFQPPMWLTDRATPWRAFVQLVVDMTNGTILAIENMEECPSPKQQLRVLENAMSDPNVGTPRCPSQIIVDPDTPLDELEGQLESIEFIAGDDEIKGVFDSVIKGFLGQPDNEQEPLLQTVGVTRDFLDQFYSTAARFYKATPWQMVGGGVWINMQYENQQAKSWGILVMGQLGEVFGVAIFEEDGNAKRILDSDASMSEVVSVSVQFCEAFDAVPTDLWDLERNKWPVAGEEAYPCVVKLEHGKTVPGISKEELVVLEAAMSVLPSFLDRPEGETVDAEDMLKRKFVLRW